MQRRTRRQGLGASIGIALLGLTVTASPAIAVPHAEPAPEASASTASASLDEAIADAAARQGVTAAELERVMAWQDKFAHAVTALKSEYPNDFSFASVTTTSAEIAFAGDAPASVIKAFADFLVPVSVVSGVGWSESAISAFGEDAHYAVYDQVGEALATNIDARSGTVTISVLPEDVELASEASSSFTSRQTFPVRVIADPTLAVGEDAIWGGEVMGANLCTTGFAVRTSSYAHGVLTAAHCQNSLSVDGIALSFRAESSNRDVQWHSTTATTTDPRFYVGPSTYRVVHSQAIPVVGQTLCKYGFKTGQTCDVTYLDNQCRGSYCDMMTMTNRLADGGDSGGPWYSSNTAYGIHSGYVTIWGALRDMFTPIGSANLALGTSTKIG